MPPEPKGTSADRFETTVGTRGSRNIEGQATVPAGLTDVAAISADFHPSLAPGADGTVVAWGYNTEGEATVPGGLSDVAAIAGGGLHSLALKGDGAVVAWGNNASGQTTVPAGLTDVLERRRWSSVARTRSGRDSLKTGAKW